MARKRSSSQQLASAKELRVHQRRLAAHERYLFLLRLARAAAEENKYSDSVLAGAIATAENDLRTFLERAGGMVFPRHRPFTPEPGPPSCWVFVDECGSHLMRSDNEFGAFVLSAVIVPFERYAGFESTWKAWKAHRLGADRGVHEPDIRRGNNSFWCEGSYTRRTLAISDLDRVITELDFTEIAVVFHRSDYASLYGEETPDGALPGHGYMMALNFLLERVAMVLEDQFGGARGQLVAESRGPKEDALLQYEFARLQLHGTSYVAAAWFRQQFTQWIVFESKKGNSSGLQMADLAARPLAEKILAPESSPPRWQAFRQKLAPGMETAHSPLGLKIFPWHDRFANLWES